MTIVKQELRQSRLGFWVWALSIGGLLAACIFLYPEMAGEMETMGALFSSMGAFTAAFGLDRLNFGSLTGFYAIECGNVLGLGGALYASLYGAGLLSKEEQAKTAEFLLTHPVPRARVVTEKLAALVIRLVALNGLIYALAAGSIGLIGQLVPWRQLTLLHLAYFLLQLELACVCFGLSAFLRRGSAGVGLGLAMVLYVLNLIANISESAAFLRYITPFAYCEGADIITEGALNGTLVAIGAAVTLAGVAAAYGWYTKKDIH